MSDEIIIEMNQTVRADFGFLATPGTILFKGMRYKAQSNPHGAISGLCANGEWLGVKPGEFTFVQAPAWVLKKHGICPGCNKELVSKSVQQPEGSK